MWWFEHYLALPFFELFSNTKNPSRWEKLTISGILSSKYIDPRPVGTIRLMMLTPTHH